MARLSYACSALGVSLLLCAGPLRAETSHPAVVEEPAAGADVPQEAEGSPDRLGAAASAAAGAALGCLVSQVAVLGVALPVLYGVELGISDDVLGAVIGVGFGVAVPLTSALGAFLGAIRSTSVPGALGVAAAAGGVHFLLVPTLVGGVAGLFVGLFAGLLVAAATGGDTTDTLGKAVSTGALVGIAGGAMAASSLTAGIAAALFAKAPSE